MTIQASLFYITLVCINAWVWVDAATEFDTAVMTEGTTTTLDEQGSPYIVRRNIVVSNGTTLIIKPGVTLLFAPGFGVTVSGALIAWGEPGRRIRFLPLYNSSWTGGGDGPSRNDSILYHWCRVRLSGGATAHEGKSLSHVGLSRLRMWLQLHGSSMLGLQPIYAIKRGYASSIYS